MLFSSYLIQLHTYIYWSSLYSGWSHLQFTYISSHGRPFSYCPRQQRTRYCLLWSTWLPDLSRMENHY